MAAITLSKLRCRPPRLQRIQIHLVLQLGQFVQEGEGVRLVEAVILGSWRFRDSTLQDGGRRVGLSG
ncbi:hypothetical protein J2W58_000600 [Pseudomonas psychrotolerans]|nr:hypothetical protein [Pseudomonas psychrotolerans]